MIQVLEIILWVVVAFFVALGWAHFMVFMADR
jgi:hypothetical protein